MNGQMSEYLYLLTLGLLCGTPLVIFGMKYVSAAYQARARAAGDNAYRELAERAAAFQTQNAAALSSIQAAVSDIGARLIAVEKILKEVG